MSNLVGHLLLFGGTVCVLLSLPMILFGLWMITKSRRGVQ